MLPVTTVHFFLLFLPKGSFPLWILVLDGLYDIDHLKYHFLINAFSKILIRCELHNFLKIATRSHYFMVCNSAEKSHVCVETKSFGTSLISLTVWGSKREREREIERGRKGGREGEKKKKEKKGEREERREGIRKEGIWNEKI